MASIGGINSVMAAALGGIQRAQQRTLGAAESLAPSGALAPVDSVEFSEAARSASVDSIASAVVTLTQAKTETAAMTLLVKAQDRMQRQAIDMLA
jgi:hypothetical protein